MNSIGIDVGSTTIKLVALDESGQLLHSVYSRHNSNIKRTLSEVVAEYTKRYGNLEGCVAVTGSGGISVARMLGLPFVQEVIATTRAVHKLIPQANAVIELGGEDAKVIYLDAPLEQRMNTTCAGGTGSFIDSIASMLGIHTREVNMLAIRSRHTYPLASRCAVFAQADVRALLNLGIAKEDIAASALEAVVKQTVGGLACGRRIEGNVVFLGGPFQYIPDLYARFCKELRLSGDAGIRPEKAHLFTACGAALEAQAAACEAAATGNAKAGNYLSLSELARMIESGTLEEEGLGTLAPLFACEEERREFSARHAAEKVPRSSITDARGPLYVGIDAGASAVKIVALDEEQNVCATLSRPANGDALTAAARLLEQLYELLPGKNLTYIAQAVSTGSGDETVESALNVDASVVETRAHVRAARWFDPQASFVFDAGGQDMKALWLDGEEISDVILNEPCSSGCGIFLEESAAILGWSMGRFAEEACAAPSPVELDTKCIVFMNSRVRHAQKLGTPRNNIAAGLAYSVAKNAYQRVISRSSQSSMGSAVVACGGVFKSDAVLRAFEVVSGCEVKRPDAAEYMGAIGAALIGYDSTHAVQSGEVRSSLAGPAMLAGFDPIYSTFVCTGCENACVLSIVNYGEDRIYVSGNRCQKGAQVVREESIQLSAHDILGSSSMIPRAKSELRSRHNSEVGNGIVIPGYLRTFGGGLNGGGGTQGVSEAPRRVDYYANQMSKDRTRERKIKIIPTKKYLSAEEVARKQQEEAKSEHLREQEALQRAAEQAKRLENLQVTSSTRTLRTEMTDIPSTVLVEREELAQFADKPGAGERARITIGLLNTLDNYAALPFWHTFFSTLGYSVMVPDAKRAKDFAIISAESIPSESVCEPAKASHGRIYEMASRGANAIFMPHTARKGRCAVRCEYAAALADNVPVFLRGELALVSPLLCEQSTLPAVSLDIPALSEALSMLDSPNAPGAKEIGRALDAARFAQERYQAQLAQAAQGVVEWLAADSSRKAVVLAGRPYHMDADILHDIDNRLSCLGHAVLTPLSVAELMREDAAGEGARDCPRDHLRASIDFVKQTTRAYAVFLHSFNCGVDSIAIEDARDELVHAHKPFAVIRLDEMTDAVHVDVYLRTLAETTMSGNGGSSARLQGRDEGLGSAAPAPDGASVCGCLERGIQREDVDNARMIMPPDMCFTAAALAARAYAALKGNPQATCAHLPATCKDCLTCSLPRTVGRALGRPVTIQWDEEWEPCTSTANASNLGERIKIGIVGNPLLCYDSFMNEGVVDLLESLGVEPVLPKPELIQVEDTRYLEQLEAYSQAGVAGVLYLQNFSCLKGHVHARGSLHELQRMYPDMPVTVLDYDPESSALNRENRIRLMVSAAKEKARSGSNDG